jgi:hypothetical protein
MSLEKPAQTMIEVPDFGKKPDDQQSDILRNDQDAIENMRLSRDDLIELRRRREGDAALAGAHIADPRSESKDLSYDYLFDSGYESSGIESAAIRPPAETPEEKSLRKLQEYHQKQAQNAQIQTRAGFYRDGHK